MKLSPKYKSAAHRIVMYNPHNKSPKFTEATMILKTLLGSFLKIFQRFRRREQILGKRITIEHMINAIFMDLFGKKVRT